MKTITSSILAPAIALLCAAAPVHAQPTAAQTCQVTSGFQWANVGQVLSFGDMKIRINARKDGGPIPYWLDVDIKAPGFAQNNLRVWDDTPVRMTVCGQDVTLTKPTSRQGLTVSVF